MNKLPSNQMFKLNIVNLSQERNKETLIGRRRNNSVKQKTLNFLLYEEQRMLRPKRVILVRHGESVANATNYKILKTVPDNQVQLTKKGYLQAQQVGKELKKIVRNESVRFYVSPYLRTRQTYNAIIESLGENEYETSYDIRIREQEYGNFREGIEEQFEQQSKVGKLYYRFKEGESGADVYTRVSDFLNTFFRDITREDKNWDNIIIISHEIIIGYFLHYFFKMVPEAIEQMRPFKNCEYFTLIKDNSGHYQTNLNILFKKGYNPDLCKKPTVIPKYDVNYS